VERRALLVELARRAAWPPALVLAVHVVASLGFHAYARLPSLDLWMHLLGGCAIACMVGGALYLAARSCAMRVARDDRLRARAVSWSLDPSRRERRRVGCAARTPDAP